MTAHKLLLVLAATICLAVPQPASSARIEQAEEEEGPQSPNVLFVAVDDLKPLMGCYGDPVAKTPHFDRLAKRAMVFTNAHCQLAVCGPSRASLLTGLYPDNNGVHHFGEKMRSEKPGVATLPEYFKRNGYFTVGMGKIFDGRCCDGYRSQDKPSWSVPFLRSRKHDWPGYEDKRLKRRLRNFEKKIKGSSHSERRRRLREEGLWPPWESLDLDDEAYLDGNLAADAMAQLRKRSAQAKPFFLAVGFRRPHMPFLAPKKYWDLYDPESFKIHPYQERSDTIPDLAFPMNRAIGVWSGMPLKESPSKEVQRKLIHGYYACVSYVDAQLGKILDELDRLQLSEKTIIVVWGDHGFHLGDHDLWCCKGTNFEQSTRSPLLIAAPGKTGQGVRSGCPVEFTDVFPTLASLAGLKVPKNLDGIDLTPLLKDPRRTMRFAAMSQSYRSLDQKPVMGYTFRSVRHRYTVWIQKDYRKGQKHGPIVGEEFYDYQTDPHERQSLMGKPAYADAIAPFKRLAKERGIIP